MEEIEVRTKKHLQVVDITSELEKKVEGVEQGLLTLYVPHTTAAVTIQEGDKALWEDLLKTYRKLVPLEDDYEHNAQYSGMSGEQNAHAHILSSLIKPFVSVPIERGKMALGTWQRILFIELDGGRNRKVKIQLLKE
ncbi:MAG: secondary thiamine-phosphate synthase enzyme YjbQ [Candidatus Natronoplasma sp.]